MAIVRTGKRERNRRETHRAVRDSALALFREKGFQKTSVADIAARAGVGERTFYRHFPSKEAVLFSDYARQVDWFGEALQMRPHDESIFESVAIALESFPRADHENARQLSALRRGALAEDTIESQMRLVQGAFSREIEAHIRERLGDAPDADLRAAVIGNALGGALSAVTEVWTRRGNEDTSQMRELFSKALGLLQQPGALEVRANGGDGAKPSKRASA